MMIFYTGLTKLKTKTVLFQDVLQASDSSTLEQLKELSSKRKAIEDSINEKSQVTEAIAREISGGLTSPCQQDIQKLDQYLPLLENLIHNLIGKANTYVSGLRIRWSSTLATSSIFNVKGSKYYELDDLYFELVMSLFLYGAMLRERAVEVLTSDLVESATLFRKAAGVYRFLADSITGCTYGDGTEERPPEATNRVTLIMSFICLAEAQAVAARKAEDENKTSVGTLAKLHYGITEFLVEAIDILQSTSSKGCKDPTPPRLLDYALSCKALHELKCSKYTANGLKSDGKMGAAIGVLRRALGNNSKKNMPRDETWRSVYKQTVDDLTALLRKCERENDFVWHEKVPCNDQLPFPQGVKIVTLIPYQSRDMLIKLAFKSVN